MSQNSAKKQAYSALKDGIAPCTSTVCRDFCLIDGVNAAYMKWVETFGTTQYFESVDSCALQLF